MPFEVPNSPDTAYNDQAEPDNGDFVILGERSTGVLSGCAVTAQGTPALFVDVASGFIVVGGTPATVSSGSLAIVAGEANPRFDLVVADSTGALSILRGTANANPAFPAVDAALYCVLAAVYVRASTSAIAATDIVDKRASVPSSFQRSYADDTSTVLATTDVAEGKTTTLKSGGLISWVNSVLQRTGDAAMQFATTLTLKAVDALASALILKAEAGDPAGQLLLDVQPSGTDTSLASISGTGFFRASNFMASTGSPEGVLSAEKGTIYVDHAFSDPNEAIWIKTTAAPGDTGWKSLRSYSASESAFPTGTVWAYIGNPASPPAGSVYANGQQLSATDSDNLALYALIGNTYGGTAGVNFNVPDLRGYSLIGGGGTIGLALGEVAGSASGTVTLDVGQLPAHAHDVVDVGHEHPKTWFPYVWKPPSEPQQLTAVPSNSSARSSSALPYMTMEKFGQFNYTAETGITIADTGDGDPVTVLGPVAAVHWMVKL